MHSLSMPAPAFRIKTSTCKGNCNNRHWLAAEDGRAMLVNARGCLRKKKLQDGTYHTRESAPSQPVCALGSGSCICMARQVQALLSLTGDISETLPWVSESSIRLPSNNKHIREAEVRMHCPPSAGKVNLCEKPALANTLPLMQDMSQEKS